MGEIVGEETGGHILCFVNMIGEYLPNSRLRINCCYKKFCGYGFTGGYTHRLLLLFKKPKHYLLSDVAP